MIVVSEWVQNIKLERHQTDTISTLKCIIVFQERESGEVKKELKIVIIQKV